MTWQQAFGHGARIFGLAFQANSLDVVASASEDETVRVWSRDASGGGWQQVWWPVLHWYRSVTAPCTASADRQSVCFAPVISDQLLSWAYFGGAACGLESRRQIAGIRCVRGVHLSSGCRAATKPQLCCRESADEYLRAQVKITLCKPVEAPGIRGVEATTRASAARLSPSWHCCTSHANIYLISYPRRFGVRTDVDKPVHAAAVPTSLSLPGFRQCRSHCPLLVCQHQHHSALLHRSAQQQGLFVIL